MMESYWPTPEAMKSNPDMAEVMNSIQKIVELKEQKEKNIAILGSGCIV